jgi:hypothetical protein
MLRIPPATRKSPLPDVTFSLDRSENLTTTSFLVKKPPNGFRRSGSLHPRRLAGLPLRLERIEHSTLAGLSRGEHTEGRLIAVEEAIRAS